MMMIVVLVIGMLSKYIHRITDILMGRGFVEGVVEIWEDVVEDGGIRSGGGGCAWGVCCWGWGWVGYWGCCGRKHV